MNIEQKLCKEKIFQLKSMPNAIRCIDKRFEVKNSGISCLALIFNLSSPRMTILHPKKWFQVAKFDESLPFFFHRLIQPYGSVVKASCGEQGNMPVASIAAFTAQGAENHCCPQAILRGTEPVSALTSALFCCCALYNLMFLEFLQWQTPAESAADRVLTLNMNIRLPLFGALGVGPCARTRPHTLAWPMGSDCSYFIASEQKYLKSLRHCFPMNCLKIDSKILKRQWPTIRLFKPHPDLKISAT